MNSEFIELNIKQGRGFLEGICDYTMEAKDDWECDYNGYIFRLNGQNYVVWENPCDGYRSYCDIRLTDVPCKNTFPPQEVFVQSYNQENRDNETNQGILIYNIDDGSLILKIGTDNYDDYYPCAVMEFHPENLPINKQ